MTIYIYRCAVMCTRIADSTLTCCFKVPTNVPTIRYIIYIYIYIYNYFKRVYNSYSAMS